MKNEDIKIFRFSTISPKELQDVVSNVTADFLIRHSILPPIKIYPNISSWFQKVKDEVENDNSSREIFLALNETLDIIAILIAKNGYKEKKICTIRVTDDYRRKGIGSRLFKKAFKYLGTNLPIITVSEEFKDIMEPFLKKYNFKRTRVVPNMYREGRTEYIYNEQ